MLEVAANLLRGCQDTFPVEQLRDPLPALILRRLALIKIIPHGESVAFTLTEKGLTVLARKAGKAKHRTGIEKEERLE